jgi:NAD(P)-dependent dehydrogenase (short-subunit alcohol dehydrogenase family)
MGNPRATIYSASKFGLAGLSETLYFAAAHGLVPMVKAIFPGLIRWGTDRFDPDGRDPGERA